ncbi:oligopeptide/dipeptide ABC transporter ATP-binding protein [Streptomyces sp. 6N223]|uniref:oligopeptide/dipeptide ABC transporter ATP-binding protein n=1 Tax=Streptomyces sp. 6N223 TaxID=3457412 RepID=UPI003FD4550B
MASLLTRKRLAERLSRPGAYRMGGLGGVRRGLRRLPVMSRAALGVLLVVVLTAVFAPVLTPHDPLALSADPQGPSADHWMGQDSQGRDILSRLMYGARLSLVIGLGATLLGLVAGAILGSIAATSRKAVDEAVMRCLDVVMAFPGIALAAVLVSVFGGGIPVLICAIAFLYTPPIARVVRANVMAQYGEDYVTAERIIGARTPFILIRHVAVNCAAPVLVFCTVQVAEAIVFEASLSFIGAGVRPPDPSWGSVIADGKNMVLLGGWWATVFPGLLMLVTVLSLNILSEGISDAWAAPAARPLTGGVGTADAAPEVTAAAGGAPSVEVPGPDPASGDGEPSLSPGAAGAEASPQTRGGAGRPPQDDGEGVPGAAGSVADAEPEANADADADAEADGAELAPPASPERGLGTDRRPTSADGADGADGADLPDAAPTEPAAASPVAWPAAKGGGAAGASVRIPAQLSGVQGAEPPELRKGRGGGEPLSLPPGLSEAGARLRERARPPVTGAPVLSVRDLRIGFDRHHGGIDVVDGISFDVRPGEVLGLVGESGCGKSLTALTVMGLQPRDARVHGSITFDGRELLGMPARSRRRLLGHEMAMVYQDALSSLNPAMTIRAQLKQLVRRGGKRTPEELLGLVGLDPGRTLRSYPHELSGGQRQRVLIAMALSRSPRLIVADEPTTALDVTVQAQIIELLLRLRAELGFALVLVSHDLALVADVTDRVAVMYGGQIAETGITHELVAAPAHHYTRGLLGSVLSLESAAPRMTQIRGVVPSPADFPPGCRFADRCPMASEVCATEVPTVPAPGGNHSVACHHPVLTPEREAAR